jgi:hypothetical protein
MDEELRPAKAAKLAFGCIPLSAILTLDHSDFEGEFHELFNASYYGKVPSWELVVSIQ